MTFTNAHTVVADLCAQMANEVYDELALDNKWYKKHRNRRAFVGPHLEANAMLYVKEARRILATLLTDPNLPLEEKDKIHDALTKDAAVRGPHDDQVKPLTII